MLGSQLGVLFRMVLETLGSGVCLADVTSAIPLKTVTELKSLCDLLPVGKEVNALSATRSHHHGALLMFSALSDHNLLKSGNPPPKKKPFPVLGRFCRCFDHSHANTVNASLITAKKFRCLLGGEIIKSFFLDFLLHFFI